MPSREAAALLDRAREDLRAARHSLDGGFVRAAVNRAYYAAFNAARAALLDAGEAPRTHAGVRNRFGLRFVATGAVADELGEVLNLAETLRNRADYEVMATFEARGAADLLEDVERSVAAAGLLLS